MSNTAHERDAAVASEALLRAHGEELRSVASAYGITQLGVAGPGRLVGRIGLGRDLFDVAHFETAAAKVLGANVELFSEGVLGHANVSPDLLAATPL